jgi:hypothetical protein
MGRGGGEIYDGEEEVEGFSGGVGRPVIVER